MLRKLLTFSLCFAAPITCSTVVAQVPAQQSLNITEKTEVPAHSLSSGTYSIRLVDRLTDRMVVEIKNARGGDVQTFLAVPANSSLASTPVGPIAFRGDKHKAALRGYSFPGGTVVEFAYPKEDAVALAKKNNVAVIAIDPASEGMPKASNLSPSDMRLISLWMLSPTPVGPEGSKQTGIQAAKYQPPSSPTPTSAATTSTTASTSTYNSTPATRSTNSLRAEAKPPVVRRLPKTASELPLIALGALCSLALALSLTMFRFVKSQRCERA